MLDDDAFWSGLEALDVLDEFLSACVPGEGGDGFDVKVDFDDFWSVAVVDLEFFFSTLDAFADGVFCLVRHEEDGVFRVVCHLFEVFEGRPRVEHAGGGDDDCRSWFFHDLVLFFSAADAEEDVAEEGVLVFVEDGASDVVVQVVRVRGVDCCDVPDHTVDVDGEFFHVTHSDSVFEDEHDFLGSSDAEDGDEDFASTFDSFFDGFDNVHFCFSSGDEDVFFASVGAFDDHRFESWESCFCGFEEFGSEEFHVAGVVEEEEAFAAEEVFVAFDFEVVSVG